MMLRAIAHPSYLQLLGPRTYKLQTSKLEKLFEAIMDYSPSALDADRVFLDGKE